MKKKWIKVLAAGIASILLVSGCSSNSVNQDNSEKPVHLICAGTEHAQSTE